MLAQPAEDVADAIERLGRAAFEWKLDGARVQVHKSGDDVRIYTRTGNDVTAATVDNGIDAAVAGNTVTAQVAANRVDGNIVRDRVVIGA